MDWLDEDLLQVSSIYHAYTVDVDWHLEHNPTSHFNVQLIYRYNWESPMAEYSTRDPIKVVHKLQTIFNEYMPVC